MRFYLNFCAFHSDAKLFLPLFAVSCLKFTIETCNVYSVKNNVCLLRKQGQTEEMTEKEKDMGNMYRSDEFKTFFQGNLEKFAAVEDLGPPIC